MRRRVLRLRPRAFLPGVLLLLGLASPLFAQTKTYGVDATKAGGGVGTKFTVAESTKIAGALDKIKDMTFTTKDSTYKGADAEKVLRKMLEDGRMGKGVGADAGFNATTRMDYESTTDGDLMNISDHHLAAADNKNLSNTLVHEWLHTTQTSEVEAEQEAPAHQLGRAVYLAKGGASTDAPAESDQSFVDEFKMELDGTTSNLPNSNAPDNGAAHRRSTCGYHYELAQGAGVIKLWDELAGTITTLTAGPGRMFFDFLTYPSSAGCDQLVIFGADLTDPIAPQGILTVVDSDGLSFTGRVDLPLPGVFLPFSVAEDPLTRDLYVLDCSTSGPGIVRMQNLDTDNIPDNILPFAPRGTPAVDTGESIRWAVLPGLEGGVVVDPLDDRGDDALHRLEPLVHLRDSDGIGGFDVQTEIVELDLTSIAPHFVIPPRPADLQVRIQAMPGHSIEIHLTDSEGNLNLGLLGSALGDPGWASLDVPLIAPLPNGAYVRAVDVTDDTQAAHPTLVEPLPPSVPATTPAGRLMLPALLTIAAGFALRRRRPSEG